MNSFRIYIFEQCLSQLPSFVTIQYLKHIDLDIDLSFNIVILLEIKMKLFKKVLN